MASTLTSEQLAQRAIDVGVLTDLDLQVIWGEYGTRNVDLEPFKQELVRRGLLTNYQLDRLLENYRTGFFYGDYKILYGVGAGTFARVFRAMHKDTGELFAVKVLRNRYSRPGTDDKRDLFRREGELGAQLKHPNIVAIHDVVSKGPLNYIVMDFVEGQNLRDFYKVRGKFAPLDATRIATDMMAGLTYAFQQGITHRDLKMSNVIVSSDGDAKLLDFGLAGNEEDADGETANPRTIDYAGLERATGVRKDDTRSDIFFAGCIYYQLLSGRPALAESRERSQRLSKTRFQEIKPILTVAPDVPPALARVVTKALELDPLRRYQTPGEMLTDLKIAVKRLSDPKGGRDGEADGPALEGCDDNGHARRLMVVESDQRMQDLLRELFKKQGYRVLVTVDPERLFQRLYDDPQAADVLLISAGHIGRAALEAFQRLGQESRLKQMPAVLLLGDQQGAWMKEAVGDARRLVVKMPLKSRQLRECVLRVLAAEF
ncbi:MAG TPA: protein kinase [Lacipirellulaceae bacterium]|nr:protein kinase [Lacipirellulaceae bacterium]